MHGKHCQDELGKTEYKTVNQSKKGHSRIALQGVRVIQFLQNFFKMF